MLIIFDTHSTISTNTTDEDVYAKLQEPLLELPTT